jgi:hypothetical protein
LLPCQYETTNHHAKVASAKQYGLLVTDLSTLSPAAFFTKIVDFFSLSPQQAVVSINKNHNTNLIPIY